MKRYSAASCTVVREADFVSLTTNEVVQFANDIIASDMALHGFSARKDSFTMSRKFLPILEQELKSLANELAALDISATCNIVSDHMSSAPSISLSVSLKRDSIYRQNPLHLRDGDWAHLTTRLVCFKQTYVRYNGSRILSLHHAEPATPKLGKSTILEACQQLRLSMLSELSRAIQAGIQWNALVDTYGAETVKKICDGYIALNRNSNLNILFDKEPDAKGTEFAWHSCSLNPVNMQFFQELAAKLASEGIP